MAIKSKKRRRRVSNQPMTAPEMPRSVTIREADNGFVIESYGDMGGMKTLVAETFDKAMEAARKLFKAKK